MTIRFSEVTAIVREGGPLRKTCCGACGQIVTPLNCLTFFLDRSQDHRRPFERGKEGQLLSLKMHYFFGAHSFLGAGAHFL